MDLYQFPNSLKIHIVNVQITSSGKNKTEIKVTIYLDHILGKSMMGLINCLKYKQRT